MRRMGFTRGYPPGYLKNAIVKPTNPSDLLTFHSDNPELKADKEEEDERSLCPTVDPEKIIHYFGFNQTYQSLNDMEQFSVPPFPVFVQYLNEHVEKEFWEAKKREDRKRKASTIEPIDQNWKKARNEEDDADCLILNAPPPPPIMVMGEMEEEKKEEEEISMGDISLNLSSIASPYTNGNPSSRRFSVGTPVLQRKNLGDGMKKVPSLDAFAVGIIPFQVDEPTPQTGFLKIMLKTIKEKLG
ncbi:hypothetical protein PENTCL1PPCAC_13884 [Pristionchus entomophagus]|uniref:PSP proline-rich domain-containing protein n=1 Tax=Pristionchus entomophagus TaxID=358040 RepID=A0AAV5TD65_9BILA|nr:hypothetical protein PENTCL1PPCAC_13884 [Pristionchus entomophagus]